MKAHNRKLFCLSLKCEHRIRRYVEIISRVLVLGLNELSSILNRISRLKRSAATTTLWMDNRSYGRSWYCQMDVFVYVCLCVCIAVRIMQKQVYWLDLFHFPLRQRKIEFYLTQNERPSRHRYLVKRLKRPLESQMQICVRTILKWLVYSERHLSIQTLRFHFLGTDPAINLNSACNW